jgi:hypothetical protein
MNHVVRRLSAGAAASILSVTGLVLLIGCAAQPAAKPNPSTNPSSSGADLNVFISGGPSSGAAEPSSALQVDVQVFAEKGQNPVKLIYTVTNVLKNEPILAPIILKPHFTGSHNRLLEATPISGTAIAESLKPGESTTGSMILQIEPMEWQEGASIGATTLFDRNSKEHVDAVNKGGTAWAWGGRGVTFRTKEDRIEVSQFGWAESAEPGWTTFEDGTRVRNATVDPSYESPTLTPDLRASLRNRKNLK